jgi:uncharacterized protein YdeI (BOF family)
MAGAALALALGATATVAAAQPLSTADNNEWITLSGEVSSVAGDSFMLDTGDRTVRVEMDDYDIYNERFVQPGDKVAVSGAIDNDFFEARKIEASTVYVEKLGEHFYASAADEEDPTPIITVIDYINEGEQLALTGTVVRANPSSNELILDTGPTNIHVDTDGVRDADRVDVGDHIFVVGAMDDADLFEGREILADSMTVLTNG